MCPTPDDVQTPAVTTAPDAPDERPTVHVASNGAAPADAPVEVIRVQAGSEASTLSAIAPIPPENAPATTLTDIPAPPGYEILDELGRGGMGVVYRARQTSLNRIVALKMILSGCHAGEHDLVRFRAEAEAAACLRHPNIIQIYEVGEVAGQPYICLELADAGALSNRLHGTPLPARDAAQLMATLASAMQTAHDAGILHRDLKPANILLSPESKVQGPKSKDLGPWTFDLGRFAPKITDFGLAKHFRDCPPGREQTQTGAIMGTPSYMAPEQAAGKTKQLGPAADIYALGAILYELLTGRPPFRAETPLDTVMQVLEREPAPPRLLNHKVDRDLETICLKCLEKDPQRRYASAQVLADDLNRYLNGEEVSARSFNLLDRLTRTLDRSQYDVDFRGWGNMLLVFAVIVLVCHTATFAVVHSNLPEHTTWLTRFIEFAILGAVFWRYRPRTLLPTSTSERQLWTIWIGYFAAFGIMNLVLFLMRTFHYMQPGHETVHGWRVLILYPPTAILSGLALFVMGSSYWGRCYAIGVIFFVLAALMPLRLDWAPLLFGLGWSGTLAAIGLHLRSISGTQL